MNQIYWTDERLWDWLWLNIQVCPDSNHLAGNCCRRTRDINFWGSIYWITRVSLAMISIIVLWFIYLFNYFFRLCILWFGEGGCIHRFRSKWCIFPPLSSAPEFGSLYSQVVEVFENLFKIGPFYILSL